MSKSEYQRPYLTKEQREWIHQRDGVENEHNHIHHIVPVAYCIALLGLTPEEINDPTNLISLPPEQHRQLHKAPHEFDNWQETREPYWHTHRDDELLKLAIERTETLEQQGNIFPGKRSV